MKYVFSLLRIFTVITVEHSSEHEHLTFIWLNNNVLLLLLRRLNLDFFFLFYHVSFYGVPLR